MQNPFVKIHLVQPATAEEIIGAQAEKWPTLEWANISRLYHWVKDLCDGLVQTKSGGYFCGGKNVAGITNQLVRLERWLIWDLLTIGICPPPIIANDF